MDTGQKTESIAQLVDDIVKDRVALPEFQRDFVWDIDKTFDLFNSFVRDIFVGSLIYGVQFRNYRPRTGSALTAREGFESAAQIELLYKGADRKSGEGERVPLITGWTTTGNLDLPRHDGTMRCTSLR